MTDEEQLWLPFDDGELEVKKQTVVLPHFPTPANDNEQLLEFQYQYRQGSQKAMQEMYELSKTICYKFIATEAKSNGHVKHLSGLEREEKAHDAAMYLSERMMRDADFAVTKSFTGYLHLRVLYELYHQTKAEQIVDYVDLQQFFRDETEAFCEENDYD